jgi:hypothetical protein
MVRASERDENAEQPEAFRGNQLFKLKHKAKIYRQISYCMEVLFTFQNL